MSPSERIGRRKVGDGGMRRPPTPTVHEHHVLRFYATSRALHVAVADFFLEGAARGDARLVIATAATEAAIRTRLSESQGEDTTPEASGAVRAVRAEALLERILSPEGDLDRERFVAEVGDVVDRLAAGSSGGVRVFGEMVDLLVQDRRIEAALDMEDLWNALARDRPGLHLFCGCSFEHLDRADDAEVVRALAARHAKVVPGEVKALDEPSARRLAVLEQRAGALEAEVGRHRATERKLRRALEERRRKEVEAQRLQEEAREARDEAMRANRAKSRLLALVSHELRTPLTAIVGYQDLLDMELKGPINDGQREFLDHIKSASEQALALMEQLLSLSRIEAGEEWVETEWLDPSALIDEVVSLVRPEARRKGLDMCVRREGLPSEVQSDPTKLRQILLNLLSNAVKFTDEGTVELAVEAVGDDLAFRVSDTGVGISASDQDRIFDRFTRVVSGAEEGVRGLGLGLALSRHLARLLGARLEVESTPGEGSTFSLWIAIRREAASPAPS